MTIGLLGGAFDPPHNGHVVLASEAVRHFDLSRLVVIVTGSPPHKPVGTPAEIRYRLARAAFAVRTTRLRATVRLAPIPFDFHGQSGALRLELIEAAECATTYANDHLSVRLVVLAVSAGPTRHVVVECGALALVAHGTRSYRQPRDDP